MATELQSNAVAPIASKNVDRRTLLKAGAWAAPVLVLTTAAPAMAASYPVAPTANALVLSNFTIDGFGAITGTNNVGTSSHKKKIQGNFQLQYNPTNWGAAWNVTVPASLAVTWSITINGTVLDSGTAVNVNQYGLIRKNFATANNLAAGTYTVVFSASAPAQTISGNTFTPKPILVSAQVRVTT